MLFLDIDKMLKHPLPITVQDFSCSLAIELQRPSLDFEVSAFGGFRGAKEGLGINVAERYVDYVLKQLG